MAVSVSGNNSLASLAIGRTYESVSALKARTVDLTLAQITSNKVTKTAELGKDVNNFFRLGARKDELKSQQPLVQDIISKMNAANVAAELIFGSVQNMSGSLSMYQAAAAMEGNQAEQAPGLIATINATLQAIQDGLNMRDGNGKYIFGSNVDNTVSPIGDIVNNTNIVNGVATTNYVNRPAAAQTTQIGGMTINHNLDAGADCFKDMIGALNMIKADLINDPSTINLGSSDLFNKGLSELTYYQGTVVQPVFAAAEAAQLRVVSLLAEVETAYTSKFEYQEGEVDSLLADNKSKIENLMILAARQGMMPSIAQLIGVR